MDIAMLEFGLDNVASIGNVLSYHEKHILKAGLVTLENKWREYGKLYFWGRFTTEREQYYIAYFLIVTDVVFPQKVFFFSNDCLTFKPLPELSPTLIEAIEESEKKIYGLPSRPLELLQDKTSGSVQQITESFLISFLVRKIDFATSVVPKGSFRFYGYHLERTKEFQGLNFDNFREWSSWVHLRPSEKLQRLQEMSTSDKQFHTDFLDSLEDDIPSDSWTIRYDPATNVVNVRSLFWPGYVAYSLLNTDLFGSVYFGNGIPHTDLPFLLL